MSAKTMGFDEAVAENKPEAQGEAKKIRTRQRAKVQGDDELIVARRGRRRRSTRTVQLNLKVTQEFYDWLEETSAERGEYMIETLEKLVEQYGSKLKKISSI